MAERSPAEDQLGVIRSLMERAIIYRAIAAPTAAVGGLLTVAAAAGLIRSDARGDMTVERYLFTWLGVLAVTLLTNAYFLWRAARRRGEAFVSPGMRMAVRAVFPAFLCAAALTWFHRRDPVYLPESWILFYGLGLLATAHFAPRSIARLGWAFVLAGIGLWFLPWKMIGIFSPFARPVSFSCLEMTFTFGLFHLLYAIFTLPREMAQDAGPHSEPAGTRP